MTSVEELWLAGDRGMICGLPTLHGATRRGNILATFVRMKACICITIERPDGVGDDTILSFVTELNLLYSDEEDERRELQQGGFSNLGFVCRLGGGTL